MRRFFSRRASVARRNSQTQRRSFNDRAVARAADCACHALESRVLLSTITWSNRVTSDNFGIYGANTALARSIVDRAIADWQRVIGNFNYSGGGNTYNVSITAGPIAGRGSTGITGVLGGKPTSASITLDDNGQGGGWYFDPTIGTSTLPDDGEFTTFNTRFESDNAVTDNDFYRTIVHELGHAVGIASGGTLAMNSFITNVGADPNAAGSSVFSFNAGTGVIASFTNDGGLHTYEGPSVAGVPVLPHDLMNSGRTVALNLNRRQLIGDIDATILQLTYGYTVTLPSQINTFYANLNTATGALSIIGDPGIANDAITLSNSGGSLRVQVNGTSELFAPGSVTSINLVAGDGNDSINVSFLPSGATVSIDAGAGTDSISVGGGDLDSNLDSDLTVTGGAGTDSLVVNDVSDGPGGDDFVITSGAVSKNSSFRTVNYSAVEGLTINGAANATTYDINSLSSALTNGLTINAGAGNDTVRLGGTTADIDSLIFANVVMNGNGGTDTLHLNDINDDPSVNDSYTLAVSSFSKSSSSRSFTFGGFENIILDAGLAANTINIQDFSANVTVNGNAGNDTIVNPFHDINTNWNGNLTIDGGADADAISLDDSGDLTATAYTINAASFGVTGGVTTNLFPYSGIETFTWLTNTVATTMNVNGTASGCTYTVSANNGDDTINVGSGSLDALAGPLTVDGGAGNDSIIVNDAANGFSDTYALTNTTLTRGFFAGLTYSTIESLTLNAETGGNTIGVTSVASGVAYTVNGDAGNDTVNVNNTASGAPAFIVNGGDGDDVVNVGNGNLDFLLGAVVVNGGNGSDAVNVNDAAATFADTYTVTSSTVGRTFFGGLNYGTVEALTVNAETGDNTININSTTNAAVYTVNAGDGTDSINVGNGNLDVVNGALTVNGGNGADTVTVNDAGVSFSDTYVLTSTTLARIVFGGLTYGTIETFTLSAEGGNNPVNVNSLASGVTYTLNGNAGNDTFNVGAGDMDSNFIGATLSIDGGAGTADAVIFDDTTDGPGVDSYTIDSTSLNKPNFFTPIGYLNFETQRLEASPNADAIVMNSSFPDWRINGNGGADSISIVGNQVGSTVTVDGGAGLDTVSVNSDAVGTAAVQFVNNQDLAALNIFTAATATVTSGGTKMLYTQALAITGNGKLDLTNNAAVIDYAGASPIAVITAALTTGYNSGAWTGNGIASSTAAADALHKTGLGYAEATDIFTTFPATFRGQALNDNTAVLINYTLYGDCDLSRTVDLTDFTFLAGNFNGTGKRWSRGNFNYDAVGAVDLTDFTMLAANFNSSVPAPAPAPAASSVVDEAGTPTRGSA